MPVDQTAAFVLALLADGAPLEVLDRLYADTPDDRRASRVGFVVAAGGEL